MFMDNGVEVRLALNTSHANAKGAERGVPM
jgi:hypothetical protein